MDGWRPHFSLLGGVSLAFAIATILLLVSRPAVHAQAAGAEYPCPPPYDVVLDHAFNEPDDVRDVPGEQLGPRCSAKAHSLINASLVTGSIAVALGLARVGVAVGHGRRGRRQI
jgi:hypothetical protein